MKTVEDFVEKLVKIDVVDGSEYYGHYPFQLLVETKDGKFEMNALALGGDVGACYQRFSEYKKNGAKRIYLSLDFPKGGDIKEDFIAIFSFENGDIDLFAIPYKIEDGETLDIIKTSTHLDSIKNQLELHL